MLTAVSKGSEKFNSRVVPFNDAYSRVGEEVSVEAPSGIIIPDTLPAILTGMSLIETTSNDALPGVNVEPSNTSKETMT